MAIWLIRAGADGSYERNFFEEGRIYAIHPELSVNLAILPDRDALEKAISRIFPAAKSRRIDSLVNQVWPFAHEMNQGDLVVLLRAGEPSVAIGEVAGDYRFAHAAADPLYHWRPVSWIARAIPRSHFGSDLLVSLSTRLCFCRLSRNNAEQRVQAMRLNGWKIEPAPAFDENSDDLIEGFDMAALARDRIARLIDLRFSPDTLAALVEALLKARGYTACRCDELPGQCRILAGTGALGLSGPRLCAQVSMGAEPVDRPALDSLLEAAAKLGAQEALFVSWRGFTPAVQQRRAEDFFRLRLWSSRELLEELLACHQLLGDDIKDGLRLHQIWSTAAWD